MKHIAILGSTGSIGRNTLSVIRQHPMLFKVSALAANENIDLLEEQANEFHPTLIAVYNKEKAQLLQKRLPHIPILAGLEGLQSVAEYNDAHVVISAMTGMIGLLPTIAAIRAKKVIGLANKEVLVSGGALIMQLVRDNQVTLIPVDSEHSAIFQCLKGEANDEIYRLILTSSGGPFRLFDNTQLKKVTVEDALNHPTWKMGAKITIDSSTLMNKGLEVIEAHWLFDMPLERIEVIIHPQSIVHSLVEFKDGALLAQMSAPNMIGPIQYALTYPKRYPTGLNYFDFTKHGLLEFYKPDFDRFRCLALAYDAIKEGGSLPCYMNAVNEILVQKFLAREISWNEISYHLEKLMNQHLIQTVDSVESIVAIDAQARKEASSISLTRC